MGGTIFISYRREEDTEFAGRLFDRLERTFRRKALFMVDSIAPGQDFGSKLETRVAECDVLLALIGRGWLTATDEAGRRRLDNTEDFVRIEIATALTQRKCVIPVLIGDVPMPQAEDLPEVLTPLVRCQATRLSHERFNADSNRLIRTLEKALAEADCGKRDWKALYTLFSDLWGRYSASSPKNRLIGQQILDHARNPSIPLERVAEEAQSFRLPIDLYGDWDKLEKLRDAFHDLQHFGFTQGEPAASVYQSAIQIKGRMLGLENEWIDEDGEPGWFYRGQRCAQWPTVPSINRELGDVRGTESEYLSRVSRIRGVVSALKSVDLAYDDLHALAIAQHYSNDLGVRTWLIDVTKSPYIALFFASDGGQDNDIGTITFVRRTSWLFWADGAPDSIGRMRFVQPTGIPRIENQDAFFIEAPHPELFYQMSHFRFYFRQRSGVVFEDTSLNLPVSRERIYPQHDLILERLPRDWDTEGCVPLTWEPALNTLSEPDEAVFEDIVRPWLKKADYIQQHVIAAVEAVCRLHAAVTRRKATLPRYIRTLYHLRRVVQSVLAWQYKTESSMVEDLLKFDYINHIRAPDVADDFAKCIVEACPEWEPIASKLLNAALNKYKS